MPSLSRVGVFKLNTFRRKDIRCNVYVSEDMKHANHTPTQTWNLKYTMHLLETRDSVFRLLLSVKADITAEEKICTNIYSL